MSITTAGSPSARTRGRWRAPDRTRSRRRSAGSRSNRDGTSAVGRTSMPSVPASVPVPSIVAGSASAALLVGGLALGDPAAPQALGHQQHRGDGQRRGRDPRKQRGVARLARRRRIGTDVPQHDDRQQQRCPAPIGVSLWFIRRSGKDGRRGRPCGRRAAREAARRSGSRRGAGRGRRGEGTLASPTAFITAPLSVFSLAMNAAKPLPSA